MEEKSHCLKYIITINVTTELLCYAFYQQVSKG